MILSAFLLAFMGFVVMSMSMDRHYLQLQQAKPSGYRRIALRSLAYALLVLACVLCTLAVGLTIGLVYWLGIITLAAFLQAMLLTYRPLQLAALMSKFK